MSATTTGKLEHATGRVFYSMHALGEAALPEWIDCAGRRFRCVQFIKHDFFAATGFYADLRTGEWAVAKIARTQPFLGLPMAWLGRRIARRELHFYDRLRDLPNVPRVIGEIGSTGLLHTFVQGRPLSESPPVPADFFDGLLSLINQLADRGIALVDTNKPENILVGTDGLPHVIDFQISYDAGQLGNIWPARKLLRMFQRTDVYHILKHKKRMEPDRLTVAERAIVEHRSWPIRLHRRLTRPYFILRRRLFARLRAKGRLMPEGSK
ncbi:MAG: hypothetical protein ACTHLZ_01435 [Tepidisphaeraceae bacterium]